MSSYNGLSSGEAREAERFDRSTQETYGSDAGLVVEPVHWEKFDAGRTIPHPYAHVLQSLGNLAGKTVLECGCGTGVLTVILAKRGAAHVDAFDISRASIDVAEKRARVNAVGEKVAFRAASIYDLEYADARFDFIVGMNILHHVDIDRVAADLHRFLKPGGVAYFNEPFGDARWLQRLRLLVPVRVNEEDRSHWEEQLKYRDVRKFLRAFPEVRWREFHLFSRLDRVLKSPAMVRGLGELDAALLRRLPFLRRYARRIVIELRKDRAEPARTEGAPGAAAAGSAPPS